MFHWTLKKHKSWPRENVFSPSNLKTWLRACWTTYRLSGDRASCLWVAAKIKQRSDMNKPNNKYKKRSVKEMLLKDRIPNVFLEYFRLLLKATKLRFHPRKERVWISANFSGSIQNCSKPLGMESGEIEDHQLSATSAYHTFWNERWAARLARLNRGGVVNAWMPNHDDRKQYIEVGWRTHWRISKIMYLSSVFIVYVQIGYLLPADIIYNTRVFNNADFQKSARGISEITVQLRLMPEHSEEYNLDLLGFFPSFGLTKNWLENDDDGDVCQTFQIK